MAIFGSVMFAVLSVASFLFSSNQPPPPVDQFQPQDERLAIHVTELNGRSVPVVDERFRVFGEVGARYGLQRIGNRAGFVIESGSGTGPIGIILFERDTLPMNLTEPHSTLTQEYPQGFLVRMRPDLSRRGNVVMRPSAPGRPVFVMEIMAPETQPSDSQNILSKPLLLGLFSVFFAALFVSFRIDELKSANDRNKQLGEDQPWRASSAKNLFKDNEL